MNSGNKKKSGEGMNACMLGFFDYTVDARVQSYVTMLLDKGYSVDVLCYGDQSYQIVRGDSVVSVNALQRRENKEKSKYGYLWDIIKFFTRATTQVTKLHLRKKYKVIHVHNVPDFLIFSSWLPKMLGAKLILDIHDILPEFYARKFNVPMTSRLISILKFVEKISCSFADHVIVANDIWRDRIVQRSARPEKCTSFINYLDTSVFPLATSIRQAAENGTFKLIYHGTYSEHHGLDVAIKAVGILRDKIGPFKLLMYGSGPYKNELINLIQTIGVENYIEISEGVPYQDVPKFLKGADLGIVPKKDGIFVGEAISTKLFQYVAMGIPTVVSRTVAEQRYFDEDEVKFFEPGNPEDMARCIQELYENPQSRLAMAQRALRKMDGYSLPANTSKYIHIIDELTSGNRR